MSWISAVKEWNAGRDKWSLPKKDTPEYAEVKKIQDKLKASGAKAAPAKNEIVEEKPARKPRKTSDETKEPKVARRKTAEKAPEAAPTKPAAPEESKTRIVSKAAAQRSLVDVTEKRAAAKVESAPAPKVKSSNEPLKPKTKEDREAEKQHKKETKLKIIEKRGELAKAKLERNTESVANLSKEIKELKIALL
jgi:hypothetical protein